MDVDPNHPLQNQNPQLAAQVADQQQQQQQPAVQAAAQPPPVQPPNSNNDLDTAVSHLTNAVTVLMTRNGHTAKVIQKPAPFKGEQGSEARRFLAGFTMWVTAQGPSLNVLDANGLVTDRRDAEWICSVLSYLHDDAAVWASPAMEVFAVGQIPFNGIWADFCKEFKTRFESANEVVDAKEKLHDLWHGKLTVPEYTARFRELMDRTGYGPDDLRDRYYDHLDLMSQTTIDVTYILAPTDQVSTSGTVQNRGDSYLAPTDQEVEMGARKTGGSPYT